ncbi:hypothetical protein B0H13DRAFT_2320234 [Mycena leptocephala]|nr:hypothetical protein B0H13DRAFT_2320234 [Mycena leptocephala]
MSARDVREYILCIGSRTPAKGFANAQIGNSQDEIRPYTACTRRGTQRGSHGLCVRKLQGASGPAYKMLGSLLRSVLPESWYTASCSVLTQLCTTHLTLNAYLFRFHLAPPPTAPPYRRQRLDVVLNLGTARLSLRRLLAAKSDSKPVLRFVRDTGRFPHYAF